MSSHRGSYQQPWWTITIVWFARGRLLRRWGNDPFP